MIRTPLLALTTALFLGSTLLGCQASEEPEIDMADANMDTIAESFVQLALAVGRHDSDYVDSYFGPSEWKTLVEEEALELADIRLGAKELLHDLETLAPDSDDPLDARRRVALGKTLISLIAKVDLLSGVRMSFDDESKALYDVVAPTYSAEHFQEILDRLEELLPGSGTVTERFDQFRQDFVIPPDKLDAVFAAAVEACRAKTLEYMDLPAGESFEIEYVTDRSWSGYNWYKGNYHSLIQVNTDLPIYIDRALDLACHEGYPGHHVYNLMLERELLRGQDWIEYSLYPLFSPRSLIAEGTANFGIEVAFPAAERLAFEKEVLFSMAGIDPVGAGVYYEIQELVRQLGYAGNEAARGYLDGEMNAETAVAWLSTYSLMSPKRAEQRLRFIEQYRAYVINYNYGQDLVRNYVERSGGTADNPELRWRLFTELLSKPYAPSELQTSELQPPEVQ
jgi:hypothetical protein